MKIIALILCIASNFVLAQVPKQFTIKSTQKFDSISKTVSISWEQESGAKYYKLSRKFLNDSSFTLIDSINGSSTSISVKQNSANEVYEYQLYKYGLYQDTVSYSGYSYFIAGNDTNNYDEQNKLLILVDDTMLDSLTPKLTLYRAKLAGNLWSSVVVPAPRAEQFNAKSVAVTKNIILKYKSLYPDIKSVLLLGRIAVPYSGEIAPDGHIEHFGAWHSEGYYGDLEGEWTDDKITSTKSKFPRQFNLPLDGKFDQMRFPNKISLAIGRVDFFDMPAFKETELQLLTQYLEKNIAYRSKVPNNRKGIVFDNFSNVYASNATDNIVSICGLDSVEFGRIRELSRTKSYLLGYVNGPGNPVSTWDGLYTDELAQYPMNVTFLSIFGSYNMDFEFSNDVMRAALASKPANLICYSGTFPQWNLFRMARGFSIGDALLLTENKPFLHPSNYDIEMQGVHIALLGDPTLDLYPNNDLLIESSNIENNKLIMKVNYLQTEGKLIGINTYSVADNLDSITELGKFGADQRNFTFNLNDITAKSILIVPTIEYTTSTGTFKKTGNGKLFRLP